MLTAKLILLHVLFTSSQGFDKHDVDVEQAYCMALNVYHESRGEPVTGQYAVAHTTMNRVNDSRYPNNVCDVVKQAYMKEHDPNMPKLHKCQFSWYCDGKPDNVYIYRKGKVNQSVVDSFKLASIIALMAMTEKSSDLTNGSTHYYNYNKVNPHWANAYTSTITVGQHTFLRREQGSW